MPDTGEGIGVARYVRSGEEPETAEVAVAVSDAWQGRGVGTALLHRLTDRAREEGVSRFKAEVLAENRPMLELIDELGDVTVRNAELGALDVDVRLPEEGVGATLRETMRAAARGLVDIRHALRR